MPDTFYIARLGYSDYPTGSRLIAWTPQPCHLTAWWTREKPTTTLTWRLLRGLPTRCVPHWTINGAHRNYQLESGDTNIHCIDSGGFAKYEHAYFVFTATIAGVPSRSISAIFEHTGSGGIKDIFTALPCADAVYYGDFTEYPTGTLPFLCINEEPPDYDTSWLRSEQTAGPFPQTGHGALFVLPTALEPQKWGHIEKVEFVSQVKRAPNLWIWDCRQQQPSYAHQFQDPHGLWIDPSMMLPLGSWNWEEMIDSHDTNPLTAWKWLYWDIDALQAGMQMTAPCFWNHNVSTYCTQFKLKIHYYAVTEF